MKTRCYAVLLLLLFACATTGSHGAIAIDPILDTLKKSGLRNFKAQDTLSLFSEEERENLVFPGGVPYWRSADGRCSVQFDTDRSTGDGSANIKTIGIDCKSMSRDQAIKTVSHWLRRWDQRFSLEANLPGSSGKVVQKFQWKVNDETLYLTGLVVQVNEIRGKWLGALTIEDKDSFVVSEKAHSKAY